MKLMHLMTWLCKWRFNYFWIILVVGRMRYLLPNVSCDRDFRDKKLLMMLLLPQRNIGYQIKERFPGVYHDRASLHGPV